ncbi:MAG TPA: DUF308 domain-containing protein [Nitrososphaeraceae archaeon]|jgi:uncharacterized membrane protein HdeD (DUF308 family)|nr:DUF308 domain-containing protein [Nitrososphaeraceae archaeon]
MTISETKSPGWMRAAQIALGVIAVVLSVYILAYPVLTFVTIVLLLGIVLFVVGIERIIQGIVAPGKSRWGTIGLGILVLIISIIVMAFPGAFGVFLIILLAIGLLFDGIARVYHGATDKTRGRWSRIFSIAAGVIEIVLSLTILAAPVIGAELVSFLLAIALLIVGIQIIVAGITGSRFKVLS